MATHSSVLAWRIPGMGSLVGCRLWGRTESDMTKAMQQQQHTYVPSLLYPLLPLSPSHLLGCHTALALGSLRSTSNSHWLHILHMVMCVFQCYSLKSSHPLLPPLCPKVCSLCLCLLCCPAHRTVSTIFLDSIYMH